MCRQSKIKLHDPLSLERIGDGFLASSLQRIVLSWSSDCLKFEAVCMLVRFQIFDSYYNGLVVWLLHYILDWRHCSKVLCAVLCDLFFWFFSDFFFLVRVIFSDFLSSLSGRTQFVLVLDLRLGCNLDQDDLVPIDVPLAQSLQEKAGIWWQVMETWVCC